MTVAAMIDLGGVTRPRWQPTRTIDPDTGDTYIYLQPSDRQVAFTVAVSDRINVDYDRYGQPLGVEVLF